MQSRFSSSIKGKKIFIVVERLTDLGPVEEEALAWRKSAKRWRSNRAVLSDTCFCIALLEISLYLQSIVLKNFSEALYHVSYNILLFISFQQFGGKSYILLSFAMFYLAVRRKAAWVGVCFCLVIWNIY